MLGGGMLGGGIAAGFERETPDRWVCPRFHEWLPLIWLPAPSPRQPTSPLPGWGVAGPCGDEGGVHSATRVIKFPQPLAGLLEAHRPVARATTCRYILYVPCHSGMARNPALGCPWPFLPHPPLPTSKPLCNLLATAGEGGDGFCCPGFSHAQG